MKKIITGVFCCLLATSIANAQSKVFREVSEGMSSDTKLIMHDDQLAGYLRFTQLEKTSKDSFNYVIEIMDENLNDIGSLKFRDEHIQLQSVAYEQDVLCLAYLKSNVIGTEFKNSMFQSVKRLAEGSKNAIVTQFISLDGEIIHTNSYPVPIKLHKEEFTTEYYSKLGMTFKEVTVRGNVEHPVQVGNVPGKGFACFFGDIKNNYLYTFDLRGKQLWTKTIPGESLGFTLHTSGESIYLLSKKEDRMVEGGFEISGFNFNNTAYEAFLLKDKNNNSLKVLSIGNDPLSGKPYLTGLVLNSNNGNRNATTKKLAKGPYDGVFTIHLDGPAKSDVKQVYSYWNDDSKMPVISKRGYNFNNKSYTRISRTFRDFNGNTYFVGSTFNKKVRWGTLTASVILLPTVVIPAYMLYVFGSQKSTIRETALLKQMSDGTLLSDTTIKGDRDMYYPAKVPTGFYDNRRFYHVANTNTKNNYLVINDTKEVVIYNVEKAKVIRNIAHNKGSLYTNVLPAKEGHVLVTEYNAKEKTTRYSIEAL